MKKAEIFVKLKYDSNLTRFLKFLSQYETPLSYNLFTQNNLFCTNYDCKIVINYKNESEYINFRMSMAREFELLHVIEFEIDKEYGVEV